MRIFTLSLLAVFCTFLSLGQNISDPITSIATSPQSSPVLVSKAEMQTASIQNSRFRKFYAEQYDDKCAAAKKLKKIGIILTGVGGGLLVGGIVMEAVGVHNAINNVNNGNGNVTPVANDAGLAIGGGVCITFGTLTLLAGVPVLIVGAVRSSRYCDRSRSYMEITTTGNGLALNF